MDPILNEFPERIERSQKKNPASKMLNTWSSHSHGRLFLRSKAKTDNANAIENDSPDQNMIISLLHH